MQNNRLDVSRGLGLAQDDFRAFAGIIRDPTATPRDEQFGWIYREGIGVERDDSLAFLWYRKAPRAAIRPPEHIGWLYQEGRGVPQADAEAMRWYKLAADEATRSSK